MRWLDGITDSMDVSTELKPVLCDNLEGWVGMGWEGEGGSRGRGHMYIYD